MNETIANALASIGQFLTQAGIRLLGAAILLIVGIKLIRMLLKAVARCKRVQKLPANVRALIDDLMKVVLYLLLIVTIAAMLGVETTSIAAVIASAGLAVGLALQGSLSNLAGGLMILMFRPFSIGDFIDDGTHSGTVKEIGVFYTTLVTPDNKTITIPNGVLSNSTVTDYSASETRRLDLKIGVAYHSDIDRVKQVLLDTAAAHALVLSDPAPVVYLGEQGESALIFYLRVWVLCGDYWTVNFDLVESTKKQLDAAGISIPFPQVDVHISGTPC